MNCCDTCGNTPLHFACVLGCKTIISLLLKWDADVNVLNQEGKSPIDYTTFHEYDEIINLLKKAARTGESIDGCMCVAIYM